MAWRRRVFVLRLLGHALLRQSSSRSTSARSLLDCLIPHGSIHWRMARVPGLDKRPRRTLAHSPQAVPWEKTAPVGCCHGSAKHRSCPRRPRARICLRKGCGRKYLPRRWNQHYCQDPDCLREVRRWQAAKRQAKRRQDEKVKAQHAEAQRQRRQAQRQRQRAAAAPPATPQPSLAPPPSAPPTPPPSSGPEPAAPPTPPPSPEPEPAAPPTPPPLQTPEPLRIAPARGHASRIFFPRVCATGLDASSRFAVRMVSTPAFVVLTVVRRCTELSIANVSGCCAALTRANRRAGASTTPPASAAANPNTPTLPRSRRPRRTRERLTLPRRSAVDGLGFRTP
jgi:hypothetical protein